MTPIRIGTRRSQLALWQANYVLSRLTQHHPQKVIELVHFTTKGDRVLDKPLPEIGGKGLFTLELENALRSGDIDLAVHSLKDLPTEMPEGFALGAIPERASPFDALVGDHTLDELPVGAVIGTSSLRRGAQLRRHRPDFEIVSLRGNVDTRIRKAFDPETEYHAVVLAMAGLERLERTEVVKAVFDPAIMLPAPGQGAVGVQCRAGDSEILSLLEPLDHSATRAAVTAERAFLQRLEAGCRLPVSAYATLTNGTISLTGRVSDLFGADTITVDGEDPVEDAFSLGVRLAEDALAQGADKLLAAVKDQIG